MAATFSCIALLSIGHGVSGWPSSPADAGQSSATWSPQIQTVPSDRSPDITAPAQNMPAKSEVAADLKPSNAVQAIRAELSGDTKQTVFHLQLTKGVTAEVFTLANPYRVIVDLPDVGFQLPESTGHKGQGLVTAFRYGQFAEGKARIVLDAGRPVLISKAEMTSMTTGGVELAVALVPTTQQAFGNGTGTPPPEPEKTAAANTAAASSIPTRPAGTKPVILIDPGHGGIDGGAVGSPKLIEKNVVLAIAKELQQQLIKTNRFDVRMTRSTDVFVSLDRRLRLSREHSADLFISLHADSIADPQFVQQVRGATVYTLSERASDEQAQRMAEKENASDLIAGIDGSAHETGGEVKGILIDLMKRETANYSADFSSTLVGKLKKTVHLSRDPQRSAAFKVLKQTQAPSVLIELGYLSHDDDQKLLGSPSWQRSTAGSIAQAVDAFFSKRNVGAATQP